MSCVAICALHPQVSHCRRSSEKIQGFSGVGRISSSKGHGSAVRTRRSDHLAGVVDEVGDGRVDGGTLGGELAKVVIIALVL